jgi:hypothetical protein
MATDDDFVTIVEDEQGESAEAAAPRWKVAIIDDDQAVHDGTRF